MTNFMDRFMGRKPSPAQSAKDRLKFVLTTDRAAISPEDMRKMQQEILDVIRKYCRIKEDDVELKFEQRERENYLVADIPLTPGANRGDSKEGGAIRIETSLTTSDSPVSEAPVSPASPSASSSAVNASAPVQGESSERAKERLMGHSSNETNQPENDNKPTQPTEPIQSENERPDNTSAQTVSSTQPSLPPEMPDLTGDTTPIVPFHERKKSADQSKRQNPKSDPKSDD